MQLYQPLQPPKIEKHIVDKNYHYQEFSPSKDLEKYVSCYWTIDFHASEEYKLHRIIPDACIDVIFNLRSTSFRKAAFVTGLMTKYETLHLTTDYSLLGIRFFADTLHYFFKYPVSEFHKKHIFLEEILGDTITLTIEEILTSSSRSKIVEKIEKKLKEWLHINESKMNNIFLFIIPCMYEYQGNLSISSLAERINYSERSIRRTFQEFLGINPKEFMNIIRFQNALRGMTESPKRFTDLASTYGYYDQSHFIHHFKRYYGKLPTQITS